RLRSRTRASGSRRRSAPPPSGGREDGAEELLRHLGGRRELGLAPRVLREADRLGVAPQVGAALGAALHVLLDDEAGIRRELPSVVPVDEVDHVPAAKGECHRDPSMLTGGRRCLPRAHDPSRARGAPSRIHEMSRPLVPGPRRRRETQPLNSAPLSALPGTARGAARALRSGALTMMRITRIATAGGHSTATIRVEGRLTHETAEELSMVCTEVRSETSAVRLDVSGLQFADATGVALLHRLEREGARLEGCSGFVSALLEEHATPSADAQLLERLRAGDGLAFEALVRQYGARMLATA